MQPGGGAPVPQIDVYCTVNNCRYWGHGDRCTAERILVTTDEVGRRYPEAVDATSAADLVRQHGHTAASSCMETCCKTFSPRDGGEQGAGERRANLVDIF
jgi:hypothetical protein